MEVKQKFSLLKDLPNTINLAPSTLESLSIANGPRKVFVMLEMHKRRIKHFSKDRVLNLVSSLKERKIVHVINYPKYLLPVTYNEKTKGIVINLSSFGVDDIYPTNPGPYNIYACMVYGICFRDLVTGKSGVNERYAPVIASYLTSLLIRMFGKGYGLLGRFSTEIPKLKFLVNCYVLSSFFGFTGNKLYRRASTSASFDYRQVNINLEKYKFSEIDDFIKVLSDSRVMPGINKHLFAAKMYRTFTVNFLPALEDLSRFISTLTVSDISGSSVVPTSIFRYDEENFNNVLEIAKVIFKRR